MKNMLLEKKLNYQRVKNCVSHLEGIEVVQICDEYEDDHLANFKNFHFPSNKKADSKISHNVSKPELIQWIKEITGLEAENIYYLHCNSLWVRIKILELDSAIESLWEFQKWLEPERRQNYVKGFLLADVRLTELIDIGLDSRDECHYLFDRYCL